MDPAIIGSCRIGYFRIGMGKHAIQQWTTLLKKFEAVASCDVTLHKLYLGSADSTTGWFAENYVQSTIKMVVIPKSAQQLAIPLGSYVRLDALGIAVDPVKSQDRVETKDGTVYVIRTVKPHYLGESFFRRECDLERLSLFREER